MGKRLGLILCILWGIWVTPSQAQEPSNPYIYYFSDTLNAFIIERANGTDTHVLGDGLMALTGRAVDMHIAGPGWSPSGEWFAWTAAQVSNYGYGWSGYRPYVLRSDGTERLTLLDDLTDAYLAWAADEDLLFVASRQSEKLNPNDPDDFHSVIDTYLGVIDVETEAIIVSYENTIFSDYNLYYAQTNQLKITRTNDGEHFIVTLVDFEGGDSFNGTILLVMLGIDGAITERLLDAYGPINITDNLSRPFPSVSSAGWVAYPTEEDFRVENVLSDEQYSFTPPEAPHRIEWDASGQYALLTNDHLWWLDCTTGTLTLLHEDWEVEEGIFGGERPVWSPDSSYALLVGPGNVLYTFDLVRGDQWEVPLDIGDRYPNVDWYWRDATHAVFYGAIEPGIFIYDLAASTLEHLEVEVSRSSLPRLSPDGRSVAFIDEGAVIYDIATQRYRKLRPNYRGFNTFPGIEVDWDATGEWLLLFEDALAAGGANIRYLGITRKDGTVQRDLGFSWWPQPITLNWLPPQVNPADLPAPQALFPQPEMVLHGSRWSFYADWSPDARWLATGLGWGSDGDITVWEANTGEIVHVFQDVSEDARVAWPAGDAFEPALVIPEHVPVWRTEQILARSPNGNVVIQNIEQQTLVIATDTGERVTELSSGGSLPFFSANFSPDGRWLAAANLYLPVRIWDTTTWQLAATLPNPGQAVAFSPDGAQLAVTASWDVQIWDVDDLLSQQQANGVNQ